MKKRTVGILAVAVVLIHLSWFVSFMIIAAPVWHYWASALVWTTGVVSIVISTWMVCIFLNFLGPYWWRRHD